MSQRKITIKVCVVASILLAFSLGLARPETVKIPLNHDDAPIQFEALRCAHRAGDLTPGDRLWLWLGYTNRSEQIVSSFEFVLLVFGPFDELLSAQRLINMLEEGNVAPGVTVGEGSEVNRFRTAWATTTCIVFISAVRFESGEVWRADSERSLQIVNDMFSTSIGPTLIRSLESMHFDGMLLP